MNSSDQLTDMELVALLRQGDKHAFEIIYKTYAKALYRYARRLITSREDCEEVVQEVFERLWAGHHSLDVRSLPAYLYTSVRNGILNYFKRAEVRQKYLAHYRYFSAVYDQAEDRDPESLHRLIEEGIGKLPRRIQEAIRLRLNEGLSNREIARRMKVTPNVVDKYMHVVYSHFRKSYVHLVRPAD